MNTLPKDEEMIRAHVLLSLIIDSEKYILTYGKSAYPPENELRENNIKRWREEYFKIIEQHGI